MKRINFSRSPLLFSLLFVCFSSLQAQNSFIIDVENRKVSDFQHQELLDTLFDENIVRKSIVTYHASRDLLILTDTTFDLCTDTIISILIEEKYYNQINNLKKENINYIKNNNINTENMEYRYVEKTNNGVSVITKFKSRNGFKWYADSRVSRVKHYGQNTSNVYERYSAGWVFDKMETTETDSITRLTIQNKYSWQDGAWSLTQKVVTKFNNNFSPDSIFRYQISQIDTLFLLSLTSFTYDASNRIIQRISFWANDAYKLMPASMHQYQYLETGALTSVTLAYEWCENGLCWELKQKTERLEAAQTIKSKTFEFDATGNARLTTSSVFYWLL